MNNFANYIGEVKAKHGVFSFCHFDKYIGLAIREYGEFSEIELSLMSKFIMKGDVVFDIGANIGAFTVPFSKKVGKLGEVYAFEPQKLIYDILQDNINKNNLKNTKVFNVGVGIKEEELELNDIDYSEVGNFGGFGIKKDYDYSKFIKTNKNKPTKVAVKNLDQFLNLKKCNLIKLEAESLETKILQGGLKFLEKFRPTMIIENHPLEPSELNKFLFSQNYDLYWISYRLFQENNYFINSKNYFNTWSKSYVLAYPKEKNILEDNLTKINSVDQKNLSFVINN